MDLFYLCHCTTFSKASYADIIIINTLSFLIDSTQVTNYLVYFRYLSQNYTCIYHFEQIMSLDLMLSMMCLYQEKKHLKAYNFIPDAMAGSTCHSTDGNIWGSWRNCNAIIPWNHIIIAKLKSRCKVRKHTYSWSFANFYYNKTKIVTIKHQLLMLILWILCSGTLLCLFRQCWGYLRVL